MAANNGMKWVSGFWRRVGALLIDSIILGLVGLGLGLALEKQFVELGGWGRFIGFFIALIYFGVLNSKLSGGQTLGKKVLKVKVVNADNQTISVLRSFARYSILGIPFFLNGAHFTNEAMTSYWLYPLSLIIFGGLFSVAYLYIFNRVSRQSLHDLIVGTFVVNADVEKESTGAVWRTHLIVVSVFLVISAIAPAFILTLAKSEPFSQLLVAQSAMMKIPSVSYATVNYGKNSIISAKESSKTTTYVNAQVFLKQNTVDDIELAKHLAKILTSKFPESLQNDVILINLTYGYDIGISSKWNSYAHTFNPKELTGSATPLNQELDVITDLMDIIFIIGLGALVILNVYASHQCYRVDISSRRQHLAQMVFIWMTPFIGAVLSLRLLRYEPERSTGKYPAESNAGDSDATGFGRLNSQGYISSPDDNYHSVGGGDALSD